MGIISKSKVKLKEGKSDFHFTKKRYKFRYLRLIS